MIRTTTRSCLVAVDRGPNTLFMTEAGPSVPPKAAGRNNRIALVICALFFVLCGAGLFAYAAHSHQDWTDRTSPPGGRTAEAVVEEVTAGRDCAGSNCADEWELAYSVDGVRHTTFVRIHLHTGDTVHAFEGADGHWHVTEDPGFGNSRFAWVIWAAFGAGALVLALFCVRAWAKTPKPGDPTASAG
jgi:hypothetical protein